MSMRIIPSGKTLGATVEGLDLGQAVSNAEQSELAEALGRFGVLCFPQQNLSSAQLRDFSQRFGKLEVNVANAYQEVGIPEVMMLSNIVENGQPLGLSDAGQSWHTDMSYSRLIAFANVLYGIRIPVRDGRPLGNTEFCNMHAAYAALPDEMKQRFQGMTVLHDFNKFWELMRSRPGSRRAPLTDAQRRTKPPVSHPLFLEHPITRRKVLYANPGYAMRINELPKGESDAVLEFLFRHQTEARFQYTHQWQPGDVLMWDDFGTIHNAVADYRPDEPRLIKRCQVMADRYFQVEGT